MAGHEVKNLSEKDLHPSLVGVQAKVRLFFEHPTGTAGFYDVQGWVFSQSHELQLALSPQASHTKPAQETAEGIETDPQTILRIPDDNFSAIYYQLDKPRIDFSDPNRKELKPILEEPGICPHCQNKLQITSETVGYGRRIPLDHDEEYTEPFIREDYACGSCDFRVTKSSYYGGWIKISN